MSLISSSRKPPEPASIPSLAAVLVRVTTNETLTRRQRQDVASALRTLATALGRSLDDLPAHPGQLRNRLKGFAPAMAGLSERRWTNVLSLTRSALKHAGITRIPGRSCVPFAPRWTALFRLFGDMEARFGLSRLARYCTTQGIDPQDVDDAVFEAFLHDLTTAALVERPCQIQRMATVYWTRLARTIPGWPQQPVTIPSYSRTYALPWSSFPPSLKRDVDAYLHRQAGADILDDAGVKPLRPATIDTVRFQLSVFVSALVHRGRDPQTLQRLSDVVATDVVKDGLRFFLDRAGGGSTAQTHRMALRVRYVAQHWVGVDAAHLAALKALCKRLDPGHTGMSEKNRDRLRQFDDPENVERLVTLPEKLRAEVARSKTPGRAEALVLQTALAIEVLLMIPLRRNNLAQLDLERHLVRSRGGVVHLVIPGHEVKNGTDIEAVLPEQTVRLLDLYVERYRPLLLTEPSSWLFPGLGDRPKSGMRLGDQISACVKRHTGLLVNTHLFRHIAAKLYLDAHPGAYGVVRLLHGHKSVDTTTRFYCGRETAAAIKHYDAHIVMRRGGRAGPSGPTGKGR